MENYATTNETSHVRVLWQLDEDYCSADSFAYETEEETAEAIATEEAALASGALVALGAIVETRATPRDKWEEQDSLWGIVLDANESKLSEYARESLQIPSEPTTLWSPASLAKRLVETIANGNWSEAGDALQKLSPPRAAATAFYLAHYLPPEDLGRMGRLLERATPLEFAVFDLADD